MAKTNNAHARVSQDTMRRVKRLVAEVRRHGWARVLSEDRTDTPTIGAVIDVAVRRLEKDPALKKEEA